MSTDTVYFQDDTRSLGGFGAGLLFAAVFAFYWIGTNIFIDLSDPALADPSAGSSNQFNQIVALLVSLSLLVFLWPSPRRAEILQPRLLIAAVFLWVFVAAALSPDPAVALRRAIMMVLVCTNAGIFLIIPRDEKQFAKLLGIGATAVLALCYYGVIALPQNSIHQFSDVLEPQLAGMWRGIYQHKNTTSMVMALSFFIGLYVFSSWSRLLGLAIAAASVFFVIHTGGKGTTAILPAIMILAWIYERLPASRVPVVVGGVLLYTLLTVGTVYQPIFDFIAGLGIDATYTDRNGIWKLAFLAISERPLTGWGPQSFWQTDALVYSGNAIETAAVHAAHSHNAYLEAMVIAGIPGLILTLTLLVYLPLRDSAQAFASGNSKPLTRLFVRIWLFCLFTGCLESIFFSTAGPVWFMMLVAVFGLRLQARSRLVGGENG